MSNLNSDIRSYQNGIKRSADLSEQLEALQKERDALVLKIEELKAKLKEKEAESEACEALRLAEDQEATQLLENAFLTWRKAASSSSKANMFGKIKSRKLMTTVFMKWKKDLAEFKLSHMEVLSEIKSYRTQKREQEEREEQDIIRKQEDLDRLRKLLEVEEEPRRVISKRKAEQMKKEQAAADHHLKAHQQSVGAVFSAWKTANESYRREQKVKRDFENSAILRSSFNAFKELSDKLKKAKEAIVKQRERKHRALHRGVFCALKAEAGRSAVLEQKAAAFSVKGQQKYFSLWVELLQQRKVERSQENYLRKRIAKHKVEAVFEGFRRGIQIQKNQHIAVRKALQARAAVFKRRKFQEFKTKSAIAEELSIMLKKNRLRTLRSAIEALLSHKTESRRLNRGFSLLIDLEQRSLFISKKQFLDSFTSTFRRSMHLESVDLCHRGHKPLC